MSVSSEVNHPEWKEENSLTAPLDRDPNNKWRPKSGGAPLTDTETEFAMKELNNTDFVDKFPRVDKTYADPPIALQSIGLISFVPAKGATPNSNGVYGFAKLRGNYATNIEADQRAEFIVRNCDSYHQIYHTYVGRPFPLTVSSKYSAETAEVDIRKETVGAISSSIKDKKDKEQQEIRDIKEREEKLIEESKREDDDPYETYITLRVKKAQLTWTYLEHLRKIDELKEIIRKTRKDVSDMDEEYPTFQETYYDKYMHARKEAGIKETSEDSQTNFIRFLVEDEKLPGIDI